MLRLMKFGLVWNRNISFSREQAQPTAGHLAGPMVVFLIHRVDITALLETSTVSAEQLLRLTLDAVSQQE